MKLVYSEEAVADLVRLRAFIAEKDPLAAGHVWHITHRCHQREFLLKFGRDQQQWQYWLFEARKRFGLSVLN